MSGGKVPRKHLERDLMAARQEAARLKVERDRWRARAEIAEAELDLEPAPLHARVTEPLRRWIDDLTRAVGL